MKDTRSSIKGAKAAIEQAKLRNGDYLKRAEQVVADATDFDQLLAYLIGAGSVCWSEPPKGVFESELAQELVKAGVKRLGQMISDQLANLQATITIDPSTGKAYVKEAE